MLNNVFELLLCRYKCNCLLVCACREVYVCVYLYTYVGVRVCVEILESVFSVYLYLIMCWLRATVFRICSVRSGPLQETRTRSGFVLVVNPIHRQFEDRSIGRSEDQYRFVQWRPDDDSVPKPRHFMWVFVLMSFSYLPLSIYICILLLSFH